MSSLARVWARWRGELRGAGGGERPLGAEGEGDWEIAGMAALRTRHVAATALSRLCPEPLSRSGLVHPPSRVPSHVRLPGLPEAPEVVAVLLGSTKRCWEPAKWVPVCV